MAETKKFSGDLLSLAAENGVPFNRAMRRGILGENYSTKGDAGGALIGVPELSPQHFGWRQEAKRHGTRRKRRK